MILRALMWTLAMLAVPTLAIAGDGAGTAFEASSEKLGSTEILILFSIACAGLLAAVVVLLVVARRSGRNSSELDTIESAINSSEQQEVSR